MANATRREDVTEVVVVEPGGVTLELSNEEAEILYVLVGSCNAHSLAQSTLPSVTL